MAVEEPQVEQPRRIKFLRVSYSLLVHLITRGITVMPQHLNVVNVVIPPGTRVLSCFNTPQFSGFTFVLEHRDWPEIEENVEPPTIDFIQESVKLKLDQYEKAG